MLYKRKCRGFEQESQNGWNKNYYLFSEKWYNTISSHFQWTYLWVATIHIGTNGELNNGWVHDDSGGVQKVLGLCY